MKFAKKTVLVLAAVTLLGSAAFAGGARDNSGRSSSGRVTLEFFNLKREITGILAVMIAEFEKEYPNIHIEQTNVPDPDQVLQTRMVSGDTPELFSSWPTSIWRARVNAGYVMDITGFDAVKAVQGDARISSQEGGKDYIIPISYNTMGVYYNKEIFSRFNLRVPKNFSEFIQVCETLKRNGVTPLLIPGKDNEVCRQAFAAYILSCPAYDDFKPDVENKKVDIAKPYGSQLRGLAERIVTLTGYAQSDILGTGPDQALNDFAAGKAAMILSGSWSIPTIKSANPDISFSMFPFPAVTLEQTYAPAFPGDFALCIAADAVHINEAKAFISFMVRRENARYFAEKDGSPSCIQGVDYVAPELTEQNEYLKTGKFRVNPDVFYTAAQNSAIGSVIQQLYLDKNIDNFPRNVQQAFNTN